MAAGPVSSTKGMTMTVDELEALIKKAETVLGTTVAIGKYHKGSWWMTGNDTSLDNLALPDVITQLREWATPPKPETLTITVPFSWVQSRVRSEYFKPGVSDAVDDICREAFKPWAQS